MSAPLPPSPARLVARWLLAAVAVWVPVSILVMATVRNLWPVLGDGDASLVGLFGGALVLVLALVLGAGRLRPADVGLRGRDLVPGLAVMVLAWGLLQLLLLPILATGAPWVGVSASALAGIGVQWLGPALFEEVVFRGFYFAQFAHRPSRRFAPGTRGHFLAAALGSGLLFSLAHLPGLVFGDASAGAALAMLGLTAVAGLYGAWLYARTQNLFVVVGLHALHNAPVTLVEVPEPVAMGLTMAVGLGVAWAWPRLRRVGDGRTAVAPGLS